MRSVTPSFVVDLLSNDVTVLVINKALPPGCVKKKEMRRVALVVRTTRRDAYAPLLFFDLICSHRKRYMHDLHGHIFVESTGISGRQEMSTHVYSWHAHLFIQRRNGPLLDCEAATEK